MAQVVHLDQKFPLLLDCASCSHQHRCINSSSFNAVGSALTTFNKGSDNLQPKVIALRSMQYTSGEMLYNPAAYADFKGKVKIRDEVRSNLTFCQLLYLLPIAVHGCFNTTHAHESHIKQVNQEIGTSLPSLHGDRQCPPGYILDVTLVNLGLYSCTQTYVAFACLQYCMAHFVIVVGVLSTVWILHDLLQVNMTLSSSNKWDCICAGSMQS